MPILNGETLRIVAQPVMAPGLIIAPIMINGENALSIIEDVQEAAVITIPQPKMNSLKTVEISLVERGLLGIVMAI